MTTEDHGPHDPAFVEAPFLAQGEVARPSAPFPPLLALIQRVIPEDQRGRVTSVFVSLQESAGLASSLALLVLGGLVVVRPTLVTAGALLVMIGLVGLRAVLRAPMEAGRDRTPA